ncbi:peptide-methionine (S)-S-oxide reductase MsrA [Aestuariibius sp. HNIBRBA575]|uniref:peptide-methionine (S)-S-oxide reductase MsrA n=1 Tax=Aestuariibius sp. HNIBRBA575 TaxID=3233343 RepID=UPI0034A2D030
MFGLTLKDKMIPAEDALAGRDTGVMAATEHFVFKRPLTADVPDGLQVAMFGMGCFWGVERMFWQLDGVYLTMVGYAGGYTPNATYEEVCSGKTGHNEVVRVVFDPAKISFDQLLVRFWEGHDPTQGMRQGNDRGTQYRSGIYTFDADQAAAAQATKTAFATRLGDAGYGAITTEILAVPNFYFAEDYHQQYLAKNPAGYCGIGGTGVTCPIGLGPVGTDPNKTSDE